MYIKSTPRAEAPLLAIKISRKRWRFFFALKRNDTMSTDPSRKHPGNAQVIFGEELGAMSKNNLRTFALIVSAHPYCARKSICQVMHRARALSTEMNNDGADGHCYSFAWI